MKTSLKPVHYSSRSYNKETLCGLNITRNLNYTNATDHTVTCEECLIKMKELGIIK